MPVQGSLPLVLFIVSDLTEGRNGSYAVQLLHRLDRERFRLAVVSLEPPGPASERIQRVGAPVYHLDVPQDARQLRPWWCFVGLAQLQSYVRQLRPQLVHTLGFRANLWGRIAARMGRVPRVLSTFRNPTRRAAVETLLARLTAGTADLNVAFGESMAATCRERWNIHPRRIVTLDPEIKTEEMLNRHESIYASLLAGVT